MRTDTPIYNPGDGRCPPAEQAADPDAAGHARLAQLLDVMIEQLQYLATHSTRACPPECPDCARFEQVGGSLLRPFQTAHGGLRNRVHSQ